MSEKPILFNTEMVRAILDGRKTQTRRLIKPAPLGQVMRYGKPVVRPPVEPGDTLWVRETWKQYTTGTAGAGLIDGYLYKADEPLDTTGMMVEDRWHPSIHMPWRAARIFLKVKSVRAGRLQDYFDASCAHAEGIRIDRPHSCQEAVDAFIKLWDSTIKPVDLPYYGWGANPWVWVIGFERCAYP